MDYYPIKITKPVELIQDGYQVVDNGIQVNLCDLTGQPLVLPLTYEYDITSPIPITPAF